MFSDQSVLMILCYVVVNQFFSSACSSLSVIVEALFCGGAMDCCILLILVLLDFCPPSFSCNDAWTARSFPIINRRSAPHLTSTPLTRPFVSQRSPGMFWHQKLLIVSMIGNTSVMFPSVSSKMNIFGTLKVLHTFAIFFVCYCTLFFSYRSIYFLLLFCFTPSFSFSYSILVSLFVDR